MRLAPTPVDQLAFRKSSYSTPQNCVEVADLPSGAAVRDTQNRELACLVFPGKEWTAMLRSTTQP
ncbi:DUF397 domain-containing protein [Nocardiopsis sp. NPDC058789]|uniref:DUF397 domain-containing protein n=1 Tax=Nocardiopsis TaxID=2013 RepID=UPI0036733E5A